MKYMKLYGVANQNTINLTFSFSRITLLIKILFTNKCTLLLNT